MKISVIMIDGGFRENTYSAKYFCEQNFSQDLYEIIWVDYFDAIHPEVADNSRIRTITLNRTGIYHSSRCFNRGIVEAKGEVLVIPDADLIVAPDFLSKVWELHSKYAKMVVYGYRYDEPRKGVLRSLELDELGRRCVMRNPLNYGGCLTVRKEFLLAINGYEQHPIFGTGFHANGTDLYTRFKNFGLAVQWEPSLRLYHPFHPNTLMPSPSYYSQMRLIAWRRKHLQWQALRGIDPERNYGADPALKAMLAKEVALLNGGKKARLQMIFRNHLRLLRHTMTEIQRVFK